MLKSQKNILKKSKYRQSLQGLRKEPGRIDNKGLQEIQRTLGKNQVSRKAN